jgi:hypothetical protein
MRASTLTSTLLTASLASARIIGLSTPASLVPNQPFTITLLTENYIQSVSDVAVAWGYQLPTSANPTGYPYTLGAFTGSSYLGPDKSNTLSNVTVDATAPEALGGDSWRGDVVFSVAVMSLYGASGTPSTTSWNVTVKVGETGVEGEVSSTETGWVENASS